MKNNGVHRGSATDLFRRARRIWPTPSIWKRSTPPYSASPVCQRGEITVRGADLSQWDAEVDLVHELLNISLGHLEDVIPWARESVADLVKPFTQIADPHLVLFAEVNSDNAGWFAGIPNLPELLTNREFSCIIQLLGNQTNFSFGG